MRSVKLWLAEISTGDTVSTIPVTLETIKVVDKKELANMSSVIIESSPLIYSTFHQMPTLFNKINKHNRVRR